MQLEHRTISSVLYESTTITNGEQCVMMTGICPMQSLTTNIVFYNIFFFKKLMCNTYWLNRITKMFLCRQSCLRSLVYDFVPTIFEDMWKMPKTLFSTFKKYISAKKSESKIGRTVFISIFCLHLRFDRTSFDCTLTFWKDVEIFVPAWHNDQWGTVR